MKSSTVLASVLGGLGLAFTEWADVGWAQEGSDAADFTTRNEAFLDLSAKADGIVVAALTSKRSYWNASHDLILTESTLAVASTLEGSVPQTLQIVSEGGEVGEVGLFVSDVVRFEPGVDYVLLLKHGTEGVYILEDDHGVMALDSPALRVQVLSMLRFRIQQRRATGAPR